MTKRTPKRTYRAQNAWKERNPLKCWAHAALRSGLRKGLLAPQPCELCGEQAEAHHDDYSRPLAVRWLCRPHHKRLHARRDSDGT